MPIEYVKGDLLDSDCDVIAHQCNCLKVMGAGIAKAIKTRYPEAWVADTNDRRDRKERLGSMTMATTLHNGQPRWIFNLYGQFAYGYSASGPQTNYSALESALIEMRNALIEADSGTVGAFKIGMPRIGCGLAGGNWLVVEKIINRVFRNVTVYIYSL